MTGRGHSVNLLPTHPNQAIFTQRCLAIPSHATAVVVGGDGTFRHFIQCMPALPALAFYGMGTANVLRIELGIPKNIPAFVSMLETGHTLPVRPGIADHKTFFTMMYSFGIDSYVLAHVSQKWKNYIGKLAFLWPCLKSLFKFQPEPVTLTLDQQLQFTAYFGIISRIRHYGGPFQVAPDADPRDPFLHIIIQTKPGLFPTLRFFANTALNRLQANQEIQILRAERIDFSQESAKVHAQMDGDPLPIPFQTLAVSDRIIPLIVPVS